MSRHMGWHAAAWGGRRMRRLGWPEDHCVRPFPQGPCSCRVCGCREEEGRGPGEELLLTGSHSQFRELITVRRWVTSVTPRSTMATQLTPLNSPPTMVVGKLCCFSL